MCRQLEVMQENMQNRVDTIKNRVGHIGGYVVLLK